MLCSLDSALLGASGYLSRSPQEKSHDYKKGERRKEGRKGRREGDVSEVYPEACCLCHAALTRQGMLSSTLRILGSLSMLWERSRTQSRRHSLRCSMSATVSRRLWAICSVFRTGRQAGGEAAQVSNSGTCSQPTLESQLGSGTEQGC